MREAAKEYGTALYSLAADEGLEDRFLTETRQLDALLEKFPTYQKMLADPSVPKGERVAQAKEALVGRFHSYFVNFVCVLIEAGRADCLRECFSVYDALYSEAHGICRADVYSAVSLSDAQKEALRHTLEKKTGKRVELLFHIDPSLFGGVRVAMEGELYDGTVRFKLDRLRDALSAATL